MAPQAAQAWYVRHIKLQNRSRYIVAVEKKKNSQNKTYLSSLYCLFSCPAWATAYHGYILQHFYTDLLWYCVKLWPLIIQRVVIVQFVKDREAIKKSKTSYNNGVLPLLYCPLVCPNRLKCTFYHFCLLLIH